LIARLEFAEKLEEIEVTIMRCVRPVNKTADRPKGPSTRLARGQA